MPIKLEKAIESEAQSIFDMQVNAFTPLLERYQDFNTSPAAETIERTITRITNPSGGFYKIMLDNQLVGAICVFWKEKSQFWISPMFILPEYQGQGIAQKSIVKLEEVISACNNMGIVHDYLRKKEIVIYMKKWDSPKRV